MVQRGLWVQQVAAAMVVVNGGSVEHLSLVELVGRRNETVLLVPPATSRPKMLLYLKPVKLLPLSLARGFRAV